MRFEVLAAFFFCFVLQCQAWNIFSNFFGGAPPAITRPPPTTTTTTTPSGPNYCNGNLRIWSECRGNPLVRMANDSCTPRTQLCSDGVLLGDLFTKNFLGPAIAPPPPANSQNQKCVVESITNANGDVIAGRCVSPSSSAGTGSRAKRQAPPQYTKKDLLILLDESGSVGPIRYEKVKRIAAAIVKLLCGNNQLHPNYTRVAIMSFNSINHFHVPLLFTDTRRILDTNADRLADYIMNIINYQGGGPTCLMQALREGYDIALDQSTGGRRHLPDVGQDIIIISDGCANCESNIENKIREMTRIFNQNKVNVYVIGIALDNQCKDLLSLLAQGGQCYHFFYLAPWDLAVDEFIYQLENSPNCLPSFKQPTGLCNRPTG